MKRIFSILISAAPVLTVFLFATPVRAAQLYFEPVSGHQGPGFTVRAMLSIDRAVNALEGVIRFDTAVVSVSRLNSGVSGTPLWITEPAADASGAISFAGIFPGGIEPRLTDRIALMELTFQADTVGRTQLKYEDVRVLLNESAPRDDAVSVNTLTVILSDGDLGIPVVLSDRDRPEPFSVAIVPGQPAPLAVFSARDPGSGISGYELRERFLGFPADWQPASGPFALSRKCRWCIIEVRATDFAGNTRVARHIPGELITAGAVLALLVTVLTGLAVRRRR